MSSSECSTRRSTASPVTPLHRALDSQGGMSVMLSKLNAHEARAKIAHSRWSRGGVRSAAGCGSTSASSGR